MPEGKDYISKTYQALRENLSGFNKTEEQFRQLVTSDTNYRNKVYVALKDNINGFSRTQDEFNGLLVPKPKPIPAPDGDPVTQQKINTITQYLQNKNQRPAQDNLVPVQQIKTSFGATVSSNKKANEQNVITQLKEQKKKLSDKTTTKEVLQAKYGGEWETKASKQEMADYGQGLQDFYTKEKSKGTPMMDRQPEEDVIQKATNEIYETPIGKLFYNVIQPMSYAGGKGASNTISTITRYGGRALGIDEITEGVADWVNENINPDNRWQGTVAGTKPEKLQGGLFNDGKINLAKIVPSTIETLTTMAFITGGGSGYGSLVGRSFAIQEQDYRNEGAKYGLKGDALDNFAVASAGLTSVLEMLSPNRLITGSVRKAFTKQYAKAISEGFTSKIATKIALKEFKNQVVAENIQEVSQLVGDKIVRLITDKVSDKPVFNDDLSFSGIQDELAETMLLTTLSTGLLSSPNTLRNRKPSNLEKSAWFNVSENPDQYKEFINKQIVDGILTPEQATNAGNFFNKYQTAVNQAKEFGFSQSQQAEVAWQIFKGNDIEETVKKFQTNPILKQTIAPQIKKEQDEVTANIKRVGLGVPEVGSEITGQDLAQIIGNIGDKGGVGESLQKRVEENDYRVEEINLQELYDKKQSFRDYVDNYDRKGDEEDGLLVPAVMDIDGKIVDGRSRLAQQFKDGKKTAQVFKELKTELPEDYNIFPPTEKPSIIIKDATAEEPPLPKGETIVTQSGMTEPERQQVISERKGESGLTESQKTEHDLTVKAIEIQKARKGGDKTNLQSGLRQEIRRINAELGYEKYKFDGEYVRKKTTVRKGKNKGMQRWAKTISITKDVGNQAINEKGIVLRDRDVELQNEFENLIDVVEGLEIAGADGRNMSVDQIAKAVEDINDGIPSIGANNVLDALEKALREDDFPVRDNFTNQRMRLKDVLGIESEIQTELLTEEDLMNWLEGESELTPEQEEVLNHEFINIVYEYSNEGSEETLPDTNTGTKEGSAKEVESKVSEVGEETKQQIENFGVPKEDVEPVNNLLEQLFGGLKKAGLTTAKTVGDWVGIGKGSEKPYSLKIDGKDVQVKNVSPEVVNGFYSPLEKTLNETKFDKLPAKQWAEKFKGEEAKWTGLTDWLNSQTGTVSKADIQQYLKDNRIQVVEVVKGGDNTAEFKSLAEKAEKRKEEILNELGADNLFVTGIPTKWHYEKNGERYELPEKYVDEVNGIENNIRNYDDFLNQDDYFKPSESTKFSQYQLEGEKENYKEVLVTMPVNESLNKEYLKGNTDKHSPIFKSSHFDEPNILVHLRMNTRIDADGKKVLLLEEVQSDWGQKGKKEGFRNDKEKAIYNFAKSIYNIRNRAALKSITAEEANKQLKSEKVLSESQGIAQNDIEKALDKYGDFTQSFTEGTPTAPFVTDTNAWTKLGLKVALKEAVKQGADKIAWTTGEQQNDRYDLSKQVDKIVYAKNEDGTYRVYADKNGSKVIDEKSVKEKDLEGSFGKDVAKRIIENTGEDLEQNDKLNRKVLKGENLSVGGKGMKGFYGSPTEKSLGIVGNVAKSLFKQEPKTTTIKTGANLESDGEVGFYELSGGEYAVEYKGEQKEFDNITDAQKYYDSIAKSKSTQHSIDITPELKASVEGGQPLFKESEAQYRIESGKNIVEAIKDFNGSPRATVALTHEIMHPTVVAIIDGAKDGNEAGVKHTKTIVNEFNKLNPKYQVTVEELIKGNNDFKGGTTSKQYRSVQEFIAKSWEKYHREGGKGFSEAFQKVLDQISKAFQSVYKSLSGKQLTPELRKMFDEILGKEAVEQSLKETPKAETNLEDQKAREILAEKAKVDDFEFVKETNLPKETVTVINKKGEVIGEKSVPREDLISKQNEIKDKFDNLKQLLDCLTKG